MKATHWLGIALLTGFLAGPEIPATAQITPAVNGTGTIVNFNGHQYDISGGATSSDGRNLFHVLKDFNLSDQQIANFMANPGLFNILTGVNGGQPSYINGLIQITGGSPNLYFLNPAGIVFGPNASLNVPAAFHASTAQRVHFDGGIFDLNGVNDYANLLGNPTGFQFANTGIIINEGNLSVQPGQNLSLMGHQVLNTGTLSAPGGNVTIVAVPETGMVRISQEGMLLSLEIPMDRIPEDGVIRATDLPALITGGGQRPRVNSVIHHADGSVSLIHDPTKVAMNRNTALVGGAIDVSSGSGMGGTINVLGKNIGLISANLDASGILGGGTMLIGGDYLGGSAGTQRLDASFNAQNLFINPGSVIKADALTHGNGGTVIAWADGSTQFHGLITARGGPQGGDGGFVETSGRQALSVTGMVDTSAPQGLTGTWLLDPTDIEIVPGTVGLVGGVVDGVFEFKELGLAANAQVGAESIQNALLTNNVIVTTQSGGPSQGNIVVNAPITSGSGNFLELLANNNIAINQSISLQNGKLILHSSGTGTNVTQTASITANALELIGAANFNLTNPQNAVTTLSSSSTNPMNSLAFVNNVPLIISNLQSTGNIDLTSGTLTLNGATITSQSGGISFNGNTTLQGNNTVNAINNNVIFNNLLNGPGSLSLSASNANFVGAIGSTTPVVNLGLSISNTTIFNNTVNSQTITTGSSGTTQIRGNIDTSNNQIYNNAVVINPVNPGSPLTINGNQINFNSTLNTGSGTIVLSSGAGVNFNGGANSVSGTGGLIFGVTGIGNFSQSNFTPLANGFSFIGVGAPQGVNITSNITVQDPLIIGSLGSINTNGNSITGVDNASITLRSVTPQTFQQLTTGTLSLANLNQLPIGQGSIIAGNISSSGGFINLAGQTISANNIFTSTNNAQIRLVSDDAINTGNLTSNGGAIALFSAFSSITTGNIFSGGGLVYLDSIGDITTGNIFTRGGNIDIAAYGGGNIATGTLDTSGSGGNISLFGQNVSTGNINTNGGTFISRSGNFTPLTGVADIDPVVSGNLSISSLFEGTSSSGTQVGNLTFGSLTTNGGNVSLTGNNILFEFINAGSGTININAGNSLRATGGFFQNGIFTSLFGSSINLFINSDTPFLVGDSSQNGAAGALSTGTTTIAPTSPTSPITLSGVVQQDTIRFENLGPQLAQGCTAQELDNNECAQIETDLIPIPPVSRSPFIDPLLATGPVLFNPTFLLSQIDLAFAQGDLERALSLMEQLSDQEFNSYFGRAFSEGAMSLERVQQILALIAEQTGQKPALIYVLSRPQQVELLLVMPEGEPIHRPIRGVSQVELTSVVQSFANQVRDPRLTETTSYLAPAQQLYQWLIGPLREDLDAQDINTLVFSLDATTRGIPMAALHDGQQFLVENFSTGLVPSMSLMDPRYRDIRQGRILAMGAEEFVDQSPLPAVPIELAQITQDLGGGVEFINEQFTIPNLQAERRRQSFNVIHLATHGEFNPGSPDDSFIVFSDGRLTLNDMPNLRLDRSDIELLTLSACRTAAGDNNAELGFAGLAVQSGIKSALASLWYVSDEGTLALMTEFYRQLNTAPIKAEALRQAQIGMINGTVQVRDNELQSVRGEAGIPLPATITRGVSDRTLTHPYYWAAFTMIGSPW
ncbi:CHAT domain-containing protein [Candidatus Synechococcus calcipolaris G9]|uniref:CHAT domain-containing protein n=1 Tax=Candidatus Synechococcus calcipolaris G9 TaxID=1497997 RepID=A0ABT6F021_9SYNE|nr:CHAT domain-containing protein [Candidatus Synechococcus calcipolaris]MDG2991209.1 CHAT domain-containing protein [Candidatus Synechococcus calcipolaris G9]